MRVLGIAAIAIFAGVLPGCNNPAWLPSSKPAATAPAGTAALQDEVGPFPKSGLFTVPVTTQTAASGIADDPAVWVHPTDPALSLVIGTDKASSGGLHVFDMQGVQRQFVAGGRHNNTDLRYGFTLGANTVDLVSACDRNNNQIDVYTVDVATRLLTPVGSIQTGISVYGYIMYHSRATGRYYGIVSSGSAVEQWEFLARSDGTVGGVLARKYPISNLVEGMVADDELGFLYVGEETHGIYKYYADPGQPLTRLATVDVVGSASQLVADIEGLTLYCRRGGLGYLIASSQGNDRYIVYRREGTNAYLGTFALSSARNTDGIDVANAALGTTYAQGLFVAQNNDVDFRMARWQDIANPLGLAIDTDGYNVRGSADCTTAAQVAVTPAHATLDAGTTLQLQATGLDGAGDVLRGCGATWSSNNPLVATVDASGLLRAVAAGSVVVTAQIGSATGTAVIEVRTPVNHPPVVTVPLLADAAAGSPMLLSATFTDDAADTHTAAIDWGDGSSGAATVNPTTRTVTGAHTFASRGPYTLTVTVTDNRGAAGQGTGTLNVTERSAARLYLALADATTLSGQAFANEDILQFDGAQFTLYFDGSDVGAGGLALDAFDIVGPNEILLSFTSAGTVGGVAMDDSDVLRFSATSLGSQTAGVFSMYFDASDVGLTTSDEDVDAVALLPDGRLLLSTFGPFGVTGVSGDDEDLVAFSPSTLGNTTTGSFARYFDGSTVGLGSSGEDVDGVAVDAAGRLFLSTTGAFSVTGLSGGDEDVCVFTPSTLGAVTSGAFSPVLFFDGSVYGLEPTDVVGIGLP